MNEYRLEKTIKQAFDESDKNWQHIKFFRR